MFQIKRTKKFWVIQLKEDDVIQGNAHIFAVQVKLNCQYCKKILYECLQRRPACHIIKTSTSDFNLKVLQFADFENIDWERVMDGSQLASSFLVRKGLSRKAQLSLQIRRFLSKNRNSILSTSFPLSLIVETWNACEDMRLDFGNGTMASFDSSLVMNVAFRQRLDWCLDDVKAEVEDPSRSSWYWILKPSVTNKGMDISVIRSWDGVLDALEATPDIREWVLQRYIDRPLLLSEHKFHLRVYVLCIGALRVYVFEKILVLIAAHSYDLDDIENVYRHLTNTARSAEDVNFDEEKFVKVLEDIPSFLMRERTDLAPDACHAQQCESHIRSSVRAITCDLFRAFENEYTIFAPMSNCFELFGLDFMVDESLGVHLLEVNPGPDFKQTGDSLREVIVQLFDQTCSLVLDSSLLGLGDAESQERAERELENTFMWSAGSAGIDTDPSASETDGRSEGFGAPVPDFTLVYRKQWSAARIKGGMQFR